MHCQLCGAKPVTRQRGVRGTSANTGLRTGSALAGDAGHLLTCRGAGGLAGTVSGAGCTCCAGCLTSAGLAGVLLPQVAQWVLGQVACPAQVPGHCVTQVSQVWGRWHPVLASRTCRRRFRRSIGKKHVSAGGCVAGNKPAARGAALGERQPNIKVELVDRLRDSWPRYSGSWRLGRR